MTNQAKMIATNLMVITYVAASLIFRNSMEVRLYGLIALGVASLAISLVYVYKNRPLSKSELRTEILFDMIISFTIMYVIWRVTGRL